MYCKEILKLFTVVPRRTTVYCDTGTLFSFELTNFNPTAYRTVLEKLYVNKNYVTKVCSDSNGVSESFSVVNEMLLVLNKKTNKIVRIIKPEINIVNVESCGLIKKISMEINMDDIINAISTITEIKCEDSLVGCKYSGEMECD